MLLYAKWFHRENNASHAELVSGSKNGCSFIFDKKYDELRCAPLWRVRSFSAMGLDKSAWHQDSGQHRKRCPMPVYRSWPGHISEKANSWPSWLCVAQLPSSSSSVRHTQLESHEPGDWLDV